MPTSCLTCLHNPCTCCCYKCGAEQVISRYPGDDGIINEVTNLELDSIPMDTNVMGSKLERQGWKYMLIDGQHFRVRPACGACINILTEARDVWKQIDRERKAKDSTAVQPDNYYQVMVGAETDSGGSDKSFWNNFQD